jgi:hypothetical protein
MTPLPTFPEIVLVYEADLGKLLAFARVRNRRIKIRVARELLDALLARIEHYARENELRISVLLTGATFKRKLTFGVCGALAGAAVGGSLGGAPGAATGALAGAAVGLAAAHLKITLHADGSGFLLAQFN